MKTCKLCKENKMSAFHTSNLSEYKHYYCHSCNAHHYKNKWWTKELWDKTFR